MTQIYTQAPVWVWPLFVLLLVMGLRARRDRQVPLALIYCLPLLGILALRSVLALPAPGWILAVFAVFYLFGARAGYLAQMRWTGARSGRFVALKGEPLTLWAMMLVFWANFAGGFLQAVAPQVYEGAVFQACFAALIGAVAGSFAGRAVQVWRGSVYCGTP